MNTNSSSSNDKEILVSIVEEISKSMSGEQSTKHWADDVLWFDIAPFASKGVKVAYKEFDHAFGQLESCKVEITETDIFIKGNLANI